MVCKNKALFVFWDRATPMRRRREDRMWTSGLCFGTDTPMTRPRVTAKHFFASYAQEVFSEGYIDRCNASIQRSNQGSIRTAIQAMEIPSNWFGNSCQIDKSRIQTPLIYPANADDDSCKESRLFQRTSRAPRLGCPHTPEGAVQIPFPSSLTI